MFINPPCMPNFQSLSRQTRGVPGAQRASTLKEAWHGTKFPRLRKINKALVRLQTRKLRRSMLPRKYCPSSATSLMRLMALLGDRVDDPLHTNERKYKSQVFVQTLGLKIWLGRRVISWQISINSPYQGSKKLLTYPGYWKCSSLGELTCC